jgi:hypothetical protein
MSMNLLEETVAGVHAVSVRENWHGGVLVSITDDAEIVEVQVNSLPTLEDV